MRLSMAMQIGSTILGRLVAAVSGSTLLNDLVSYWPLDELSGTRADAVGDNDLADNNTVLYSLRGPSGTVAKFTSADADYLEAASPIIVPTASFSVAGWCYRATQADGGIVNVDNSSNRPFNIDLIGNSMRAYPNGGYIAYGPAAPPIGQWFFFCGSVNREELALGRVHMWVNGAEGATRDMDGAINATTGTVFRIGTRKAWNDSNSPFRIARIGVWAKALTVPQQLALMNGGNGKLYDELSDDDKVGLTAYWDLDEASGNRADSHSTYTLTDNNTVESVNSGPVGTVASFIRANTEDLSGTGILLADDFTISVWLKQSALTYQAGGFGAGVLSSTFGDKTSDWMMTCPISGKITLNHWKSDGLDFTGLHATTATFPVGVWLHVVATRVAGTYHIWVNGVDQALDVPAATSNGWGDRGLRIGSIYTSAGYFFEGNQSAAGIWTRVLTSGEIASLFASGNGKTYADLTTAEKVDLVSYWSLDEASGTRVDSHGSNDLTDNNTVGSVINAGGAMDGAAASFVAANTEYLSIDNVTLPSPPLTISAWFKSSQDTTRANLIFGMVGTSWPNYAFGIHKAWDDLGPSFIVANGPFGIYQQNYITTAQKATLGFNGQWHHVVAWVDTDKVPHLTVDGTAALGVDGSDLGASPVFTGPATLKIGHRTYDFQGTIYEGGIDEVSVWNRILTADERTELYNSGAGKFYPFE